jgi:hypothetical protein
MYNYRIVSADRSTHIKVALVALIAGVVIVVGGLAALPKFPDMSTQIEARAPVLKAGKPVIWTNQEQISIR